MERKISKSGSVTIPSNMRMQLGIQGKEKIDIQTKDNGDIVIKRIQGTCIFCGNVNDVRTFKGKFLCKECNKELFKG